MSLGVTSYGLSETMTIFGINGREHKNCLVWIGVIWGLYFGFFFFSSPRPLTLAQCQTKRTLSHLFGMWQIAIGGIRFVFDLGSQFFHSLFLFSCVSSKNVPFFFAIAHNFETSGWNGIRFESQGDIEVIHSFSHFDLRTTSYDLCMTLQWCQKKKVGGGCKLLREVCHCLTQLIYTLYHDYTYMRPEDMNSVHTATHTGGHTGGHLVEAYRLTTVKTLLYDL